MQCNINCGPQAVPENLFFAGSLSRPSAVFPTSSVTATLWKEKLTKQPSNTLCLVLLGEKEPGDGCFTLRFWGVLFFFSNQMYLKIFFKQRLIYLIFWSWWLFVTALGLSLAAASGGYSLLQRAGFSLQWVLLHRLQAHECQELPHWLGSFGAPA